LSHAIPAHLQVNEVDEDGQILDLDATGCKVLPAHLEELLDSDILHSAITLVIGEELVQGRVVWATPNYSALGCTFDRELGLYEVERLNGRVS
jgi:hypothetical protein